MKKRSSPKQEPSEVQKIEKLMEGNSEEFRRNAQLLDASQAIARVGGWELDFNVSAGCPPRHPAATEVCSKGQVHATIPQGARRHPAGTETIRVKSFWQIKSPVNYLK